MLPKRRRIASANGVTDSRMAGLVDRMEISDPGSTQHGLASGLSGYYGIWRNGTKAVSQSDAGASLIMPRMLQRYPQNRSPTTDTRELQGISGNWRNSLAHRVSSLEAMTGTMYFLSSIGIQHADLAQGRSNSLPRGTMVSTLRYSSFLCLYSVLGALQGL